MDVLVEGIFEVRILGVLVWVNLQFLDEGNFELRILSALVWMFYGSWLRDFSK